MMMIKMTEKYRYNSHRAEIEVTIVRRKWLNHRVHFKKQQYVFYEYMFQRRIQTYKITCIRKKYTFNTFQFEAIAKCIEKKKTRQLIYLTGIMTTNRRFLNISDVYLIQYSILKPISFSPIQNLKTDLHLVQYGFLKPIFNLSKREFKTIFLFSPIKNLKKNIECDIHLAGHVQLNITFVLLIFFFMLAIVGRYQPITALEIDQSYDEIRCPFRILLVNRAFKRCLHLKFEFT